ncbi:MAG: POTRA domain-containing protein [Bryobacteraceae bacterium]|nr:POTRA domain-containing protein [Bryobacteraceae bacterium]
MRSLFPVFLLVFGPALWPLGASTVSAVHIEGTVRRFDLSTRPGASFDDATVTSDVRRLWETGAFDDVRVERRGEDLVFRVVEKPRAFLGKVEFTERSPDRKLRILPGAEIDEQRAHNIARSLEKQLKDEGYAFGRVRTDLSPAGARRMDLRIDVDSGDRYRIFATRFTGEPGVSEEDLRDALRLTRKKKPYVADAVDADLHRIRSLYAKRGYFDARVSLGSVDFEGDRANLEYSVDAGRRYDVGQDWWR